MNGETQDLIAREIHCLVKGIEVQFDVTCDFTYLADYPPLCNDADVTAEVLVAAKAVAYMVCDYRGKK
ncbi:hypothetical protein [Planomicrobium soli]|uniref:hypothetical protein n=1 Tax=Planomicrobium soli TaxID=1176648 RepID=UPI000D0E316A|nr:hypothetical protein [Planomicrobium soli]